MQKIQLKKTVDMVLHVPGNFRGPHLEMAVVFDCSLEKEMLSQMAKDCMDTLKKHDRIFQNVRLNILLWKKDEVLEKEVIPAIKLQTGIYFENYMPEKTEKRLELLTEQLKKFYARSKLILIFTEGKNKIEEKERFRKSLKPFLEKKTVFISPNRIVRGFSDYFDS